jgi:hypothetical protein
MSKVGPSGVEAGAGPSTGNSDMNGQTGGEQNFPGSASMGGITTDHTTAAALVPVQDSASNGQGKIPRHSLRLSLSSIGLFGTICGPLFYLGACIIALLRPLDFLPAWTSFARLDSHVLSTPMMACSALSRLLATFAILIDMWLFTTCILIFIVDCMYPARPLTVFDAFCPLNNSQKPLPPTPFLPFSPQERAALWVAMRVGFH